MWVIMNRENGRYVSPPGEEKSYTEDLRNAWVFRDREKAEKQRCPGNETVIAVEEVFRHID